ncbi:MAG: hypothetical protein ACRD5L_00820, partial [Bryobacteraceae bacterium]
MNPMKLTVATVVLFLGVAGLAFLQVRTINNLHALEAKLASVQSDQAKAREMIDAEAAQLRDSAAAAEVERQKALNSVRDQVIQARRQAPGAAGQVKEETQQSVAELAARVHANEAKIEDKYGRVASEITGLKQATSTTQSDLNSVSTEVNVVKTDVANTKNRLENTIAGLGRMNGDMNLMSGLIATN